MVLNSQIVQTQFLDGQGLGNQLWVYAAGRSLAKKLDRTHVVVGLDAFKGANFLNIDTGIDPDPTAPVEQFNEALYYDSSLKYLSSTYDSRVESLPLRAQINGLFQSEQYFYGRLKDISTWIRPSKYIQEMADSYRDVCVLNLRGGEYKRHKAFILPRSYWDMAISVLTRKYGDSKILVVTDDPAYARAFLPEFPVLEGGVAECYAALMGAKALAVSNSSFSYFPIKTRSDIPFVIAPEHWARYGNSEGRWAMPCNIYKDWFYLSTNGTLLEYSDCQKVAAGDAAYYENAFNVRVPQDMVTNLSITRFMPAALKLFIKRVASYLFPKRFG